MRITAVLPISRLIFLDRVIESLENQTKKPNHLLVVYDGHESELIEARNRIVGLNFESVLFVQSNHAAVADSIPDRRRHIVNIHNQFRALIGEADWVFSIEDDGILPPYALEKLLSATGKSDLGMITGVELGRWGVPYVGAWRADDINDTKEIVSLVGEVGRELVEEIDACGLYCALIRAEYYKKHEFFTHNGLGPDVNLGLFLRQNNLKNYIHWGIPVTHLTVRQGVEEPILANSPSKIVRMKLVSGNTWHASR